MKRALTIVFTSALITTGVIKAAPALAQEPASEVNVSLVRTADLNLATSQGQRKLERRLAQAAREVCGTASDVDVAGKNEVRKCRDETLAIAREQRDGMLASRRDASIAVTASR